MDNPLENSLDNFDWYQDVVQNAPDIFNVVDRDGTFIYTNSRGIPTRGDSFIGTTIYEYFLPEYYETVKAKIARVFDTGEISSYELASDYLGVRRYYMTNLAPIRRNGEIVAVVMYIREITDLKRMQHAMEEMNDTLETHVQQRTQKLQELAERLQLTERLSAALRRSNCRNDVLKILGELFSSTFLSDTAGIYRVEDQHLLLTAFYNDTYHPPERLIKSDDQFFFSLLEENSIHFVQVPSEQKENCNFCRFIHRQDMKTLVVVPLWAESSMVGVIYLAYRQRKNFSEDDIKLMNSFVEAAGNTLHRINLMKQLENNIANRENQQQILYNIMAISSVTVDIEELLQKILDEILSALNCGIGIIRITDNNRVTGTICYPEELPPEFSGDLLLTEKMALDIPTYFTDKNYIFLQTPNPGFKNLVATIRSKGKILGIVSLIGECLDEKDNEIIRLITGITDEIGLAVENARHRKRSEETLLLEERQRLARDLHDAVSQSLYGLVLSADISKKLLRIKEFDTLETTIHDIETFALQSLREMRLMLFELRPISFESEGLTGALDLRLNTVERRAGILTDLVVLGEELIPSPLDMEIYRVATEALNNALKHSNASQIKVNVHADRQSQICDLLISDNGRGFDMRTIKSGGIGIHSMQERAARVGGTLTVSSNPAQGTSVHLVCPLNLKNLDKK
ncbi:MAG: PAS domain-containing protein [Anaerolineae bacterium]|nr:PAS domain-containing protein [Anaerolineae bacterium]